MKVQNPLPEELPSKGALIYALCLMIPIFGLVVCMLPYAYQSYVTVFFDAAPVIDYSPISIVMVFGSILLGIVIYEIMLRLIGHLDRLEKVKTFHKARSPYFTVLFCLGLGSFVVSIFIYTPLMHERMVSHGFERCWQSQSPLSRAQFKKWVKAPATCEYWDLWTKDQKLVLERYKEEGVWVEENTVD